MSAKKYEPLGYGFITWLGVNPEGERFSQARESVTIVKDGIVGDKYRGLWRKLSPHDVDYEATDGVCRGDLALNLRQITIVADKELSAAAEVIGIPVTPDKLRANMAVSFQPHIHGITFSQLSPGSRMIIGRQGTKPKVLTLTEENGPCRTIARPLALDAGSKNLADAVLEALKGYRGQMSMVRSKTRKAVRVGDPFIINPPMERGWNFMEV